MSDIDYLVSQVERALVNAVNGHKNFDNSASHIMSMVMNLQITPRDRENFLNELKQFLQTYDMPQHTKS